jgi:hypothetical protein
LRFAEGAAWRGAFGSLGAFSLKNAPFCLGLETLHAMHAT